jgi:hypothetical protein
MKSKPPKEIQKRRELKPRQQTDQESTGTSFWRKIEWVLGLSVGIAGLLLTALQFQARPTASLGTPLNPTNVLTTPITISNDGLTNLQAIRVQSFFRYAEYEGRLEVEDTFGNRALSGIETLATGEKEDVLPVQLFDFGKDSRRILKLDFALVVKFRPAYWPWEKRKFFRFGIAQNSDGTVRLRQEASGDIDEKYDAAVARQERPSN